MIETLKVMTDIDGFLCQNCVILNLRHRLRLEACQISNTFKHSANAVFEKSFADLILWAKNKF